MNLMRSSNFIFEWGGSAALPRSEVKSEQILWRLEGESKIACCKLICMIGLARLAIGLAMLQGSMWAARAAESDLSKLPPSADVKVDFDRHIRPIFEQSCFRCHGPERPKSGFRLDRRDRALKGGDVGVAIVPGNSADSPLIHYVAGLDEDLRMPPEGKGDPLTSEQIGLLRAWIDQGAPWVERATERVSFSVAPTIQWVTVSGDERRFRDHQWMQNGWDGGFQQFRYEQVLEDGRRVALDGKSYFNRDDYEFRLLMEKPEFGFARFGFEQYRRFYDDTGGFFGPFATNSFSLERDLYVNSGRAWIDLGLTLPHWPRVAIGYEYQYRDGERSFLGWSDVVDLAGPDGTTAAIYPGSKEINETVHILKFNASHELNGFFWEDDFRGEFYDLNSARFNRNTVFVGEPLPDRATASREEYEHFNAVNTFRVEKQFLDWLFVSGGYLFSKLNGDAGFSLVNFMPANPGEEVFEGERSDRVVLDRRSHVFSGNTALGPWDGLTFTAGLQSEWTREEGFSEALIPSFPSPDPAFIDGDRDKAVLEELFGVRYTKIPFTVIYADTRFKQEGIDHFESQWVDDDFDDDRDFLRETDATTDVKEYRGGFNFSPWRRISLHSSYKHSLRQNGFDHETDIDRSEFPGNGYSAFIRQRDIESDEVEAKLSVNWASWLRSSFKYQMLALDYRTRTDPAVALFFDPVTFLPVPTPLPGGSILAGTYDAHIYSVSTTLTPWRRLALSSTFSYSDSRTLSGVRNGATVVPYAGDLFSLVSSATVFVSARTDWHASYALTWADFEQENAELGGLPLGIAYSRHGLVTGFTRRFKKNISTRIQYGYFQYDEPSFGGSNNYTAHAIFATMAMTLP